MVGNTWRYTKSSIKLSAISTALWFFTWSIHRLVPIMKWYHLPGIDINLTQTSANLLDGVFSKQDKWVVAMYFLNLKLLNKLGPKPLPNNCFLIEKTVWKRVTRMKCTYINMVRTKNTQFGSKNLSWLKLIKQSYKQSVFL